MKNLSVPLEYRFTAAYGDSKIICPSPSIRSPLEAETVILYVFAFPASSLIVKYCPAEKPDAAGKVIFRAAPALTPRILSLTVAV